MRRNPFGRATKSITYGYLTISNKVCVRHVSAIAMAVGSRLARVAAATLARGNTLAMKKHMRGFERRAAHLDRLKHRVELT